MQVRCHRPNASQCNFIGRTIPDGFLGFRARSPLLRSLFPWTSSSYFIIFFISHFLCTSLHFFFAFSFHFSSVVFPRSFWLFIFLMLLCFSLRVSFLCVLLLSSMFSNRLFAFLRTNRPYVVSGTNDPKRVLGVKPPFSAQVLCEAFFFFVFHMFFFD